MSVPTLTLPAQHTDPRQTMDGTALVVASRNAYPVVAAQTGARDNLGLLAGAGGALLLGAITLVGLSNGRETRRPVAPPPPAPPAAQVGAAPAPAAVSPAPVPAAIAAPPQPASIGMAAPLPAPGPQAVLLPTPTFERDRAPALILDAGEAPRAAGPAASAMMAASPGERAAPAGLSADETFGFRVGEAAAETTNARRMVDPALTVAQGTLIPAVLETAIDSDLPGYVRAVVSQDVRSFDGTRVLIPRSSRVIGQYKSGLSAGQTRAYVVWSRLIRPDGVSVALASPAVDAEGRTGLAGQVDNHFLKRFGSSMLLSVIGAAGALRNGGLVISSGDSAASVAAQRDSQTPPTIRVRQGQPIRIFTARDLNFASIEGGARS